jgi:hypothetical protein
MVCVERILHLATPGASAGVTWIAYDWLETGETVLTPPINSNGAGKCKQPTLSYRAYVFVTKSCYECEGTAGSWL